MFFCPYCGTKVKEDEVYCLNCGKTLPSDLSKRIDTSKRKFNRLWLLPISLIILILITYTVLYLHAGSQKERALAMYGESEQYILNQEYDIAIKKLEKAIELKPKFEQAIVALEFVQTALNIEDNLKEAKNQLDLASFNEALALIDDSERELRSYHGKAATNLIDLLLEEQDFIKLSSLSASLEDQPTIDDLKLLLWDAEAIKMEAAQDIAENIRSQIADYAYSKAVELLNKHQFSDAQLLLDDALRYASNSVKLMSLQQTIEKEKAAFETEQQYRIEQAIHLAEEERELNEMEAVDLLNIDVSRDDQNMLIVTGEVKSVATIPIHSIIVEYSLFHKESDDAYVTNKAFVFPDTLYPGERGKFEFIHYDIDEEINVTNIQTDKFTWYTN